MPRSTRKTPPASRAGAPGKRKAKREQVKFAPHERSSIDFFVRMGALLSVPKSVAEIYGFLYVCPEPISFPEIERRLALSKGSVSEGLRFLKDQGMVEAKRATRGRADLWSVSPSLAAALANLLRNRVQPALEAASPELRQLQEQASAAAVPAPVAERLARLSHWNERALELLPLLLVRPPSS